jgi:hypothetical protein
MDHPSDEIFERFATGKASREESKAVVAHLIKGCGSCAARLRARMEPEPVGGHGYDDALSRFDRDCVAALETSVSPRQALQAVFVRAVREERPDGKRREEE